MQQEADRPWRRRAGAGLVFAGALAAAGAAPAEDWSSRKCALYGEVWMQAAAEWPMEGIGQDFLDRHDAFLASGCAAPASICPSGPAELALAEALTVAAMNFGAASTFAPFACRAAP